MSGGGARGGAAAGTVAGAPRSTGRIAAELIARYE